LPERIAQILPIVRILLAYGRHLASSLEERATARNFSVIAQCFGTAKLPVISAQIYRGILRAIALERLLLARAARGLDLTILAPRTRAPRNPPADQDAASAPAAPDTALRPARRPAVDRSHDPDHYPTMAEIEAEVQRRPIGRVIADICRDLGVRPGLCDGGLWNDIFEVMRGYRGNFTGYARDMYRRKTRFVKELDHNRALDRPEQHRDGIRRALGFFIGEAMALPSAMIADLSVAAATGPP
jgi:hypothetical protein